jgi:hypothetical protein
MADNSQTEAQHLTATNGHWAGEGHRRALLARSLREI